VQTEVGTDMNKNMLVGVALPLQSDALHAMKQFGMKKLTYVQLLSSSAHTELHELPGRIPKEAPRYHFFLYRHRHQGQHLELPGYKCSIRDRMLYSSCKNNLLETVENRLQIHIVKKLSPDFLYEEVHPREKAHPQAFPKPQGPPGKKGARRITRPQRDLDG
ncbi:hypothetical protein CRUP_017274, partial [Coryphaenoides rupestris]